MNKNFLITGDMIGRNYYTPSACMVYRPSTNMAFPWELGNSPLLTNNERIVHVPNTGDFITSADTEAQLLVHHSDGTSTTLPAGGGTGQISDVAVSATGNVIAFFSTATTGYVTVYDRSSGAYVLVGRYEITNMATSDPIIALNHDGTEFCVGSSNKPFQIINSATGAAVYTSTGYKTPEDIWFNVNDSKWLILDSGRELYTLDSTNDLTVIHTDMVTTTVSKTASMSPDGSTLVVVGYSTVSNIVGVDLTDYSLISVTAPATNYSKVVWADDTTLLLYAHYTTAVIKSIYRIKFEAGVFGTPELLGPTVFDGTVLNAVIRSAPWEVTGTITDTAEETNFNVRLFLTDGNTLVGQTELGAGETTFTCPCSTPLPVMVVITGAPNVIHKVNTFYGVGAVIITGDTDYSFTCTTSGTTDLTKPAYPTSGSITDGSAVFAVRSRLAKPNVNYPVYPSVA